MTTLSIDFETGSECPLLAQGSYRYATDPSTEVYMMGWAFDNEPAEVWSPDIKFPERIIDHIESGGIMSAWNAQFERLIFNYVLCNDYQVPVPKLEQFQCTAARARAHGLPGALDNCGRALGLNIQKSKEGKALIDKYSANAVHWDEIPEDDWLDFLEYCKQDVEVERSIGTILRPLTDYEWREYHTNERISDRGIPVDLKVARAALGYAEEIRLDVNDRLAHLTGGAIVKSTARKTRDDWVLPQLSEDQLKLLTVYKGDVKKISFDQEHRDNLALHETLPEPVGAYLTLMDEAGGATISKYRAMLNREIDGRIPGALVFNGAGQTGRFSSMGLQMHNLRRDTLEEPELMIRDLLAGFVLPEVTTTLARMVRSAIMTKHGLSWFDWSSIEGRVAPWLQGGPAGRNKLQLYTEGVDPYVFNAASTFRITMEEVTKAQRQAGKLQELALQFLGGVGALKVMGRSYGMVIEHHEGEHMRDAWRKANPWAQMFGRALEAATMNAVGNPGKWYTAGRVRYAFNGDQWLWCELPSGRWLAYYMPRIEQVQTPWGEDKLAVTTLWGAAKPKVGEQWPRRAMHGGLWIENVTQATAADILREAVVRVSDELPIVLHVHDEIIVEGLHEKRLGEIMLEQPAWAEGLPLDGDGGSGVRYGK